MKTCLQITMTDEELEWVCHAARLRAVSAKEYVRQAINARLRREGVDAVLLRERPTQTRKEVARDE